MNRDNVAGFEKAILKRIVLLTLGFLLIGQAGMAQNKNVAQQFIPNKKVPAISVNIKKMSLGKALRKVARRAGIGISYKTTAIPSRQVSYRAKDMSLYSILDSLLKNTDLYFKIAPGRKGILIKKRKVKAAIQQETVTGTVTDDQSGNPLPGVNIKVKGTTTGTTTNAKGHYSLSVPSLQDTLIFSYIGYKTKAVPINGRTRIKIKLSSTTISGKQMVVVGYGKEQKQNLTGSVTSISSKEITQTPSSNPLESLKGKVPGADIVSSNGSTTSGVSILLRGHRSIAGSNSPLFVVDGDIVGDISGLDPDNIKSIQVLKDAASTAIYGSRGANGVILITTKQGQAGKPKVSVNVHGGIYKPSEYPPYMSGPQWVKFMQTGYKPSGTWKSPADNSKIFTPAQIYSIHHNISTNWRNLVFRTGSRQNYHINVSGGDDNTNAYASLNYSNDKGILHFDHNRKYATRIRVNQTVNDVFSMGLNARLTHNDQNRPEDVLNRANKYLPVYSPYDSTGHFRTFLPDGSLNPLVDQKLPNNYANQTKLTYIRASGHILLSPIKSFNLRSKFSANIHHSRQGVFMGTNSFSRNGSPSRSKYNTYRSIGILWENILHYNKNIGPHTFKFTGVTSYQSHVSDQSAAQGDAQLLPSQLFYGLSNAKQNIIVSDNYTRTNHISFTGRLNYHFKDKYLLTLTGREDGSSRFASGHRWNFFPAIAVGWRIAQEKFMQNVNSVSQLKLRASYGATGNDPLGPYAPQSTLTRVAFGFENTPATGYTFSPQIGNKDLHWELSKTTDIGFDFGFLNNRVSGTVDVYNTKTNGLLLTRSLPPSVGATRVIQNVGQTRDRGIDFSLTTNNVQSNNFSWNTRINYSTNQERILKLVGNQKRDVADGLFVGHPINVFYDYKKVGIWQKSQAQQAAKYGQKPGEIHVKDINGDGKITTADRTILGSTNPKWHGSIENNVNYRNFDLHVAIWARIGQMIAPDYRRFLNVTYENQAVHNYWTPSNPTNAYPEPNLTSKLNYLSTLYYINGSYVKIRNITLGYNIPKGTVSNIGLNSFRIYATLKNWFTFSKTNHYDPEQTGGSENLPMTKSFIVGINVKF